MNPVRRWLIIKNLGRCAFCDFNANHKNVEFKSFLKIGEELEQMSKKYIVRAQVSMFYLCRGSPIFDDPQRYLVENLKADISGNCFAFDESNGLKWSQKQVQRQKHLAILAKAINRHIGFEKAYFLLIWEFFNFAQKVMFKLSPLKYLQSVRIHHA